MVGFDFAKTGLEVWVVVAGPELFPRSTSGVSEQETRSSEAKAKTSSQFLQARVRRIWGVVLLWKRHAHFFSGRMNWFPVWNLEPCDLTCRKDAVTYTDSIFASSHGLFPGLSPATWSCVWSVRQTLLLWVIKNENWVYLVENCQLCTRFGQKRETLQATKFCKNFVHSPTFYWRNSWSYFWIPVKVTFAVSSLQRESWWTVQLLLSHNRSCHFEVVKSPIYTQNLRNNSIFISEWSTITPNIFLAQHWASLLLQTRRSEGPFQIAVN